MAPCRRRDGFRFDSDGPSGDRRWFGGRDGSDLVLRPGGSRGLLEHPGSRRDRRGPGAAELGATAVVAIIPARDEACRHCRHGLVAAGPESTRARSTSSWSTTIRATGRPTWPALRRAHSGPKHRLDVIAARDLPPGWTGKLWAVSEGLARAREKTAQFFLLTDADIVHAPDNVSSLVRRARAEDLDLTSLMVRLSTETMAEKALIPSFVFFFFMLYPPRKAADPRSRVAGAAGGCMLVRPVALERIGGIAAIRGALIDDCALAAAIKRSGGRIRLDPSRTTRSSRVYDSAGEIWSMIARTAFTQLRYSWILLVRDHARHGLDLCGTAASRHLGDRLGALAGSRRVARHGVLLRADRAPLRPPPRVGRGPARHRRCSTPPRPLRAPSPTGGAAGDGGRAGFRRRGKATLGYHLVIGVEGPVVVDPDDVGRRIARHPLPLPYGASADWGRHVDPVGQL